MLEKTLTLAVAQHTVAALTSRGFAAQLTRDADVNLALKDRAHVALAVAAPVFVSIHFNGDDDEHVQGTETWIHSLASQASQDLAVHVQRELVAATGLRDRQVKNKGLGVLNPAFHHAATAACLVEVSFLTDPDEEERLRQASYLDRIAQSLANGISTYLAATEKPQAPQLSRLTTTRRAVARASVNDGIKHVVVLMFENRSFDHMIGSLRRLFPDLDGIDPAHPGSNVDPRDPEHPYFQRPTSTTAFAKDPQHGLADVRHQLDSPLGPCGGFVDDFIIAYNTPRDVTQEVMGYFDVGDLPAMHRLASAFTICDRWFSSVPASTWTNRLFAHSGTSLGRVAMPHPPFNLNLHRYNQTTVYDRLNERHVSWRIYYGDVPQSLILEHQRLPQNAIHYRRFAGGPFTDSFEAAAAGPADRFPQFVFIEPNYFGQQQNDQHPPSDVIHGDLLLARVYNAIRRNESLWQETLLVVLHDEHGGFYDHVYPSAAIPPDTHTEEYTFDQFGVRVPALLVSPWFGRKVLKTEFDHTSVLRYVSDKWQLGPLGARVAAANSFAEAVLSSSRTDAPAPFPEPDIPRVAAAIGAPPTPPDLNDLQRALVGLTDVLENETSDAPAVRISRAQRLLEGGAAQAQVAAERVERFLAEHRRKAAARAHR